jgi:hypothetical protein
MSKAVAKKEETAVAVNQENIGKFGAGIDADDIIIPKVLLMQSISQLVDAEKAKAGDFVHSLDEVVIGAKEEKPVEFIVLGMYKTLQTYEDDKYVKTEPLTSVNKNLPYEEVVGATKVNRTKVMNYYVIRPSDIEAMQVFPMVISFKRTSFKAGKKLATKLTMLEEFGAPMYAKTFNLVATQEEGEKGKYYVMDIKDGRKSNDVEVKQAEKWMSRLETEDHKVDESEDEATTKTATPVNSEDIPF